MPALTGSTIRQVILALGSGSGILSVLVLTQYLGTSPVERLYSRSEFIWITVRATSLLDQPLVADSPPRADDGRSL